MWDPDESTLTDKIESPERPRTIAFGDDSDDISKAVPKSVGLYDYRTIFPEHKFQHIYYIASLVRDVLEKATYYGFSDDPQGKDIDRLPRLDQFIAQIMIITNAPYCVLSGTLRLLLRYYGEDSERNWQQCWMNAYDTFLAAFILAYRASKDVLEESVDLTDEYWGKVATYNCQTIARIVECFEMPLDLDIKSDVQVIIRSFNDQYKTRCDEGELERRQVLVKMFKQQAKGTIAQYCSAPASDALGPVPKVHLSELQDFADKDGAVEVPYLLSHILRKEPPSGVKPRSRVRKFYSKLVEHLHK